MKPIHLIAALILCLVISLPICYADELKINYDANGNVVTDGQFYWEYNGLNQLVRLRNGTNATSPIYQEYVYDPIQERINLKKTYFMNGSLKETVLYFSRDYVRVINATGTYDYEYAYLDGQIIAQVNPDGSKIFMETDYKGDIVAVTNSSGKMIENNSYSPFGELLTGGKLSRYSYEAKEHDSVVGDLDFHARKMNPGLGIFLQPDSLVQNFYIPQSLDRFMFELGNPYILSDTNGHSGMGPGGPFGRDIQKANEDFNKFADDINQQLTATWSSLSSQIPPWVKDTSVIASNIVVTFTPVRQIYTTADYLYYQEEYSLWGSHFFSDKTLSEKKQIMVEDWASYATDKELDIIPEYAVANTFYGVATGHSLVWDVIFDVNPPSIFGPSVQSSPCLSIACSHHNTNNGRTTSGSSNNMPSSTDWSIENGDNGATNPVSYSPNCPQAQSTSQYRFF